MTVVRFTNKPDGNVSFNSLLSDVFTQATSLYRQEFKGGLPVKIKKTAEDFLLEIKALGFAKGDFTISLENDMLTIAGSRKNDEALGCAKVLKNEFNTNAISKSFTLIKTVDVDGIGAAYHNGILVVTLPKKEEIKPVAKQININ